MATTERVRQQPEDYTSEFVGVLAGSVVVAVLIAVVVIIIYVMCKKRNDGKHQADPALIEDMDGNDDDLPDVLPMGPMGDAVPVKDDRTVIWIELDDSPSPVSPHANGIHNPMVTYRSDDVTAMDGAVSNVRPDVTGGRPDVIGGRPDVTGGRPDVTGGRRDVTSVGDLDEIQYANAEVALHRAKAEDGDPVYSTARPWDEDVTAVRPSYADKEMDSGIIIDTAEVHNTERPARDGDELYAQVDRRSRASARNSAIVEHLDDHVEPDVPDKSWDRKSTTS